MSIRVSQFCNPCAMKRVVILVTTALIAAACSGGSDDTESSSATAPVESTPEATDPPTTESEPPATDAEPPATDPPATDPPVTDPANDDGFAGTIELDTDPTPGCEPLGLDCLLPFPSDGLTVADETTPTGRRVALAMSSTPVNASGVATDPARQNRNDGFSPGSAALLLMPGIDVDASALPPITDIAQSVADGSGSVVVDATTGELWPHWAELDANATDPAGQGLFLRPAVNYPNGHRIVVGIRNAVDTDGNPIEPTDVFRAYRDRLDTGIPEIEERRDDMEAVFADLEAAGVARDELTIAWDFTVISTENLTGPLVFMRDDAFGQLGENAPAFTINAVEDDVEGGRSIIEGTYEVPLYLEGDGTAGNGLNLVDGSDLPTANGTWTAPFRCQVTDSTSAAEPGAALVYGHGLLGSERQATSSGPTKLARDHNYVVCGTPLIGMAEDDVGNAVASLQSPSNFSTFADRLLQGHLNTTFLGRLMIHPEGLVSDPAFSADDGAPLIDTDEIYYYGISQGGIMGPVSTAISPDWDRGVFGVPGVNYSTLLNRSIDFDTYQAVLDPEFPDKLDQAKVLLLIQMLWDRGEGNGYVNHFGADAEPLANSGPKLGLLQGALGDHQVANVAMDVMARTMGAAVAPGWAEARSTDVEPFWGIDRIESFPYDGSAVVTFDSGTPLPPITNTPPRDGTDPHGDVRVAQTAVDQIAAFLSPDGAVIDTCDGGPCIIDPAD